MLPLIPLAVSLVPELIRLISGDKAGSVATSVANVVTEVTGTSDPQAAQAKLAQDPAIAANLRIRLAEIALQAQTASDEADEKRRQADLEGSRVANQNTSNARDLLSGLAEKGSWIAAAPLILSAIVTIGFFAFLIILMFRGLGDVSDVSAQIINIAVGSLTAGFATVISFWLGSSQGSRDKDVIARAIQFEQGSQNRETLQSFKEVVAAVSATPRSTADGAEAVTPAPGSVEPVRSEPATPAKFGLLAEIMPTLVAPHRFFAEGVPWALQPDGISIDGAPPRGTAGNPDTVSGIWKRYGDRCSASAKRYGVPVELVVATIATESGGNPNARRAEQKIGDESVGLMQTLVATARQVLGRNDIKGEDLLDPVLSIEAGTAYIAQQRGSTHFDPPLVAAAYNAGSLRRDNAEANRWKLLCYPTGTGRHLDNFANWFADCMKVSLQQGWGKQDGVPSFAECLAK
jgi:hypothetical protein